MKKLSVKDKRILVDNKETSLLNEKTISNKKTSFITKSYSMFSCFISKLNLFIKQLLILLILLFSSVLLFFVIMLVVLLICYLIYVFPYNGFTEYNWWLDGISICL